MSQMTSLLKALKHCENVRVLVATATVAVRNAHAPVGNGSSTSPASQIRNEPGPQDGWGYATVLHHRAIGVHDGDRSAISCVEQSRPQLVNLGIVKVCHPSGSPGT